MELTRATAVVDTHTGGEPTRIIIGGGPYIPGKTMSERWAYMKNEMGDFRDFVMHEPRGHSDMFGAFLTSPEREDSHYGVIFMDSGDGVTMCGHGSIGTAHALVELGMVPRTEPYTEVVLDSPAGQIRLKVEVNDGRVGDITLANVPAFVFKRDVELAIPSLGGKKIHMDVSFGGNFFAIVHAEEMGLTLERNEVPRLLSLGLEILREANRAVKVQHPTERHLDFIGLTEFALERPGKPTKNCVVFGESNVDRSPCGTGTCAKMALLAAKGLLKPGEVFDHESVAGSVFHGHYEPGPKVGGFETILPFIRGRASITGFNFLLQQKNDEMGSGFLL
ncbi:MAG TPA: proline racemase family protein [Synergistales bacterium]|nr:proline racemase family protein [Synergistales bacterium]HPK42628.1 proline racemase family protein [Synergistales bacterium]